MNFQPHDYQAYAINRIINQNEVCLFLDMGLGKTVITLTAINELMWKRFAVDRVLIIAPLRVAEDTWTREVDKWSHLHHFKVVKVLGSESNRIQALRQNDADIFVINRENVEWLVNHLGRKWFFDMVVIDELSSFKSPTSKRFKSLRKVRPFIKQIVGLTGTPTPNGLLDLWPQMYLMDRGERLGKTIGQYRDRYFKPGRRNGYVVYNYVLKDGSEEEIHKQIEDITVSMSAKDWLTMPERIDRIVPVRLDDATKKAYQKLEKNLLLPFDSGDIEAANAAVLSNKLLQLANGAIYNEHGQVQPVHDKKLDALEDLIEAANGKPILIFYTFKHDAARIQARFNANELKSAADIKAWNDGKIPLLLAHPASAGHGLNLQAGGNIIVWFGLTWSLELYQQANARLHRQGQTNNVIVHHLVCDGTIDEDVIQALTGKAERQDALLEAVKARWEAVRA